MNVVDLNVLLALYREDHDHHVRARRWWDGMLAGSQAFHVPDLVWVGFCRLVTTRSVLPVPATFEEAWVFVEAAMAQPGYLQLGGGERVLREFARIGADVGARGPLIPDVYIAAVARAHGATVVTFDRDFRKFDGVRVVEPA